MDDIHDDPRFSDPYVRALKAVSTNCVQSDEKILDVIRLLTERIVYLDERILVLEMFLMKGTETKQ